MCQDKVNDIINGGVFNSPVNNIYKSFFLFLCLFLSL